MNSAYEVKLYGSYDTIDNYVTASHTEAFDKFHEWVEDTTNNISLIVRIFEWKNGIRLKLDERVVL